MLSVYAHRTMVEVKWNVCGQAAALGRIRLLMSVIRCIIHLWITLQIHYGHTWKHCKKIFLGGSKRSESNLGFRSRLGP